MSPKEKKQLLQAKRLNDRLIARLLGILGKHGFLTLGLSRARMLRRGEVMLVVARNVYCKGCGKRHRTLIHLASTQKNLTKLFKK